MTLDLEHLRTWIGRTDVAVEVLSPVLARHFNATFNQENDCETGDVAPLLIHFCLAQPTAQTNALGEDGHRARGEFLPPVPLPRRMWAGGAITFHGTFRVGDTVKRHSTIRDVKVKEGRSGTLCFVIVDHEITSNDQPVLSERQDIVYREMSKPSASGANTARKPAAAPEGAHSMGVTPTPLLLFRYSAITFNAHRIHYDQSFAREVEGYPGLIVHGPLQATMLCQYAADLMGAAPKSFSYRSLSPIFDTIDFTVNAAPDDKGLKLWTAGQGGPVAMEAHAKW